MLEPFNTPNPQFVALQGQQPPQLPPLESEERVRFQTELEFVQALANPHYIHRAFTVHLLKPYTFLHCRLSPARILQGQVLRQLPEVSALLDAT